MFVRMPLMNENPITPLNMMIIAKIISGNVEAEISP
jgi:hypothetical protein